MHENRLDGAVVADAAPQPVPPEADPVQAVTAVSEGRSAGEFERDVMGGDGTEADGYGDFDWPEGYAADPKAMARFVPLARSLGLPRENAQKLAHLYIELEQEKQRAQAEFIAENNARWLGEIHGHPEFGGANLQRTADNVAAVMRRYGTPALLAQVRQMNIQNWPEMFFFLARVSQSVNEDCSPSGTPADAPAKSTAQILFPGLN